MEIFYQEINKGNLNIEVSVHDDSQDVNLAIPDSDSHPPFHVFLTARDEASRKIWTTPVMEKGTLKSYQSITEAVEDAKKKLR
jgi:hypothetical protein